MMATDCGASSAWRRVTGPWSVSAARRLGGELGAAHAHAAARVLPQPFGRMQVAEGARHRAEVKIREPPGDVSVIERLLRDGGEDLVGQRRDRWHVTGFAGRVFLAVHVVADLGGVGI